jgi:hypothetical protein
VSLAVSTGDAGELSLLHDHDRVPGAWLVNHAAPVRKTGQQTSVLCWPASSVSAELTR